MTDSSDRDLDLALRAALEASEETRERVASRALASPPETNKHSPMRWLAAGGAACLLAWIVTASLPPSGRPPGAPTSAPPAARLVNFGEVVGYLVPADRSYFIDRKPSTGTSSVRMLILTRNTQ